MKRWFAFLLFTIFPVMIFSQAMPQLVWSTEFTFGGNLDRPIYLAISYPNIFVSGYEQQYDSSTNWYRIALARFSDNKKMSVYYETVPSLFGIMIAGEDGAYLCSDNGYASKIDSGGVLWRIAIGDSGITASPAGIYENKLIIIQGTTILALNQDNHTVETFSSFSLPASIAGPISARVTGNYLWICGQYRSGGIVPSSSFLLKIDLASKQELWRNDIPDGVRAFFDVTPSGTTAYLAATRVVNQSDGFDDFTLRKIDGNGNTTWEQSWFGRNTQITNYENWVNGVTIDPIDTSVIIGGCVEGSPNDHTWYRSAYLAQFDRNGNEVDTTRWNFDQTATINQVNDCKFDAQGNLFVLGNTNYNGYGPNGGYLQKYAIITGVPRETSGIPKNFGLSQNYPNPFNPTTRIEYRVPSISYVVLTVYDVLGREVAVLVNEEKSAGNYSVVFNANNLPSGIYFYRLQAGNFTETKKMILVK